MCIIYFFSLWRVLDVLYQPHLLITTGTFSKIVRIQYFLKYVAILLQLPVQISSHTHGHEGKWVTSVSCVASKLVQVESVWGQYFDLILFCNLLSFNCISMITCEIKFYYTPSLRFFTLFQETCSHVRAGLGRINQLHYQLCMHPSHTKFTLSSWSAQKGEKVFNLRTCNI